MKFDFESKSLINVRNIIWEGVKNRNPTTDTLASDVAETCRAFFPPFITSNLLPRELLDDDACFKEFVDAFCEEYANSFGIHLLRGNLLSKKDIQPWVNERLSAGTLKWNSWTNYSAYLMSRYSFSKESIEALDDITNDVLNRMGDPKNPCAFRSQGLLMGDVQSGKTATYTAICHKAIDAGYRIIIVMTGMIESLRAQTQQRLNRDLIGRDIDSSGRQKTVDEIIRHRNWTPNPLTTPQNDFNTNKIDASIAPEDSSQVSILVIKKNARILANLLEWFTDTIADVRVGNIPCLVIDDEADNASINTKENDTATINGQIRDLLKIFHQVSFLAVTATPFANVFIDPQIDPKTGEEKEDSLPDLFPRDYILCLPPPKAYLGVERLFGQTAEANGESFKYRCVIELPSREKIKKDNVIVALPKELRKAVLYFACACTYEDFSARMHNTSMLVHIARFVNFQEQLLEKINELIEAVKNFADVNAGRTEASITSNPLYKELCTIWNEGTGDELWYTDPTHGSKPPSFAELSKYSWEQVWKKRFGNVVKTIRVLAINSQSDDRDLSAYYETHQAKIIAVGGDALSRGLTLEGLCVSYFERSATAYDTLLQMGRWFGYRNTQAKYMRIWISKGLVLSFRYIAEALEEFKQLLNAMRLQGRDPSNFGLKIKLAPKNSQVRLITASNKSRAAKKIRLCVDVAGRVFQSGALPCDEESLLANEKTIRDFVFSLGKTIDDGTDDMAWTGVSGKAVASLLEHFKAVAWSNNILIADMANKLRENYDDWNVRVLSVRDNDGFEGIRSRDLFGTGRMINCSVRSFSKVERGRDVWIQPRSKAILSKNHFVRGLSPDMKNKLDDILQTQKDETGKEPNLPAVMLGLPGAKPTLLIYPVLAVKDSKAKEGWTRPTPIFALVFGLPSESDFKTSKVYMTFEDTEYMANILNFCEKANFPE